MFEGLSPNIHAIGLLSERAPSSDAVVMRKLAKRTPDHSKVGADTAGFIYTMVSETDIPKVRAERSRNRGLRQCAVESAILEKSPEYD